MTSTLEITTLNDREIVLTRSFRAPRELMFDCWTRPELVKRWLYGPSGWSFAVCEIDLRPGGGYRFVWRKEDGAEMGMSGVYREVVRPERIVSTERYDDDWTGGEALGTIVFTEQPGGTLMTHTLRYASAEARDAVLRSGMDEGLAAGYDRLEAHLATIA